MIEIKTERLYLRSNCSVVDGKFTYSFPEQPVNIFDLRSTDKMEASNSGFLIFLHSGELVGSIDIKFTRLPYELGIGTKEGYRCEHYMSEAMAACIKWIFDNCSTDTINGIDGHITHEAAVKLLTRNHFKEVRKDYWVLDRATYLQYCSES